MFYTVFMIFVDLKTGCEIISRKQEEGMLKYQHWIRYFQKMCSGLEFLDGITTHSQTPGNYLVNFFVEFP